MQHPVHHRDYPQAVRAPVQELVRSMVPATNHREGDSHPPNQYQGEPRMPARGEPRRPFSRQPSLSDPNMTELHGSWDGTSVEAYPPYGYYNYAQAPFARRPSDPYRPAGPGAYGGVAFPPPSYYTHTGPATGYQVPYSEPMPPQAHPLQAQPWQEHGMRPPPPPLYHRAISPGGYAAAAPPTHGRPLASASAPGLTDPKGGDTSQGGRSSPIP
ncbi:hypothetical protein TRAPUB_5627 [Trametes pubescens]|nr:hypothetical protein TRAPUB_5627 [Trametes pubescens]